MHACTVLGLSLLQHINGHALHCLTPPAGLLNVDDPELVRALVQRAAGELALCLQPGGDMRRARLLLRFAAALVVTNVLHAASVAAALRALVDTALAIADAGELRGCRRKRLAAGQALYLC